MTAWHDEGNGIDSLWVGNGWLVRPNGRADVTPTFVPMDPDCKFKRS